MRCQTISRAVVLALALPAIVMIASCRPVQAPPEEPAAATATVPAPEAGNAAQAVAESTPLPLPLPLPAIVPGPAEPAPRELGAAAPDAPPAPGGAGLPTTTVPTTTVPTPIASLPGACGTARNGPPATLDAYKREVACHIHARNGVRLYEGAPPPLLRSVVVLSVRIDAAGRPVKIGVLRSNGVRELERRAMQSVRDAAPLPAPGERVLRQGMANITETWLFRDDGRFQVRTLAAVQASAPD